MTVSACMCVAATEIIVASQFVRDPLLFMALCIPRVMYHQLLKGICSEGRLEALREIK